MKLSKIKIFKKVFSVFLLLTMIFNIFVINIQSKPTSVLDNKDTIEKIKINNGNYDLLIISPQKFKKYLQPLINHKTKYNIKTEIFDTKEIYNQICSLGRDKAEKIKYFIKDEIERCSIKYVLLVGGRKDQTDKETWWIPVRYSYLHRPYDNIDEKKFLSDLYFADIYDTDGNFSSWDTDNDGIFGEWEFNKTADDIPDLYPDIAVGRLPCRNIFQLRTIVKKIINYEKKQACNSWFKKMIVVAGDTYPNKTEYYDGEVYTQMGLDVMQDFKPIKLWASDGSLKNGFDVVKKMNKGSGFVWFSGHGNAATWVTHPPDDNEWIGYFQLFHLFFLRNRNKLPVCISGSGCFNNMFNASLSYTYKLFWRGRFRYHVPYCWGWALTKKAAGGSIAVIASTAFSYESPDIDSKTGGCELLDLGFFKEYNKNNSKLLGQYWKGSITQLLDDNSIDWLDNSSTGDALIVKNVEQWLLIGDPSLKIGGYP